MQEKLYKDLRSKIVENCKEEIKEFKKQLKRVSESEMDSLSVSVPPAT